MSMITDQVWLVYGTLEWCWRIRCGIDLVREKRLAQRFDGDESGNVSSSAFLAFLKGDVESGEQGNPSLASLKGAATVKKTLADVLGSSTMTIEVFWGCGTSGGSWRR